MIKPRLQRRKVNGILLLNKPQGISSNQALQIAKRIYRAEKAGHTGSLDPLATGMLPICFGEATKFCQFLLEADKRYQVTMKLGVKTTTGDAEGEIISQAAVPLLSKELLLSLFTTFTGTITQIPSMYSALKHEGQPLYKYAREGIAVERKKREIKIFELALTNFTSDTVDFIAHCSKGTYIRTLVEDMGEHLGCGAYVTDLHRLEVAGYKAEQMQHLAVLEEIAESHEEAAAQQLLDNHLLPVDSSLTDWPQLRLSDATAYHFKQGQPVLIPHAPTKGWVRLNLQNGRFIGVGEILSDGRVAPRRLVSTQN